MILDEIESDQIVAGTLICRCLPDDCLRSDVGIDGPTVECRQNAVNCLRRTEPGLRERRRRVLQGNHRRLRRGCRYQCDGDRDGKQTEHSGHRAGHVESFHWWLASRRNMAVDSVLRCSAVWL